MEHNKTVDRFTINRGFEIFISDKFTKIIHITHIGDDNNQIS